MKLKDLIPPSMPLIFMVCLNFMYCVLIDSLINPGAVHAKN